MLKTAQGTVLCVSVCPVFVMLCLFVTMSSKNSAILQHYNFMVAIFNTLSRVLFC